MKDEASKGASVQSGLSEVEKIGGLGSEHGSVGKDQKPAPNPKTKVKAHRPGSFRFR